MRDPTAAAKNEIRSETMKTQKISQIGFTKGGITSKILFTEKINVTLFAFDKRQELSTHSSSFPAMIQVLEGKLKITIGGKAKTLGKNELAYLPPKKPHAVKALTKAKMLLFLAK